MRTSPFPIRPRMSWQEQLEGYKLAGRISAKRRSQVHAAVRASDAASVVLKVYVHDALGHGGSQAQRELEALRAAEGPGMPRGLECIETDDAHVLVLERVPGITLLDWVSGGLPTHRAFVEVAIQLAAALARVHAAHRIHCDVTPGTS